MSGIAGIVRKDGSAVDAESLEALTETLDHRGPDGSGTVVADTVGLGQQRLYTTPESKHEDTPRVGEDYLLTADARIDNRAELLETLDLGDGISNGAESVVTDADLIVAAYEEWGTRCPERLVGAYAFALWDRERRRLFCARDHAGIRPFFYYDGPDAFVFGSELKAVLRHDAVPCSLEEAAVGDFLLGIHAEVRRTFYRDVYRLEPGHVAVVDDDGTRSERYWRLDPTRSRTDESVDSLVAGFRDHFEEAVRCRLRTATDRNVATTLSGGLDSSSITCTAADNRTDSLTTTSLVFPSVPESDEREYIRAVVESGDFDPTFVAGDKHSPLEHVDEMVRQFDVPFLPCNLYFDKVLYEETANTDASVLLEGFGGDVVVSHGLERYAELASRGKFLTLAGETSAYADRFGGSRRTLLRNHVAVPLCPDSIAQPWQRLRDGSTTGSHSRILAHDFLERTEQRREREIPTEPLHHRTGAATRARITHAEAMESAIEPRTFETTDIAAAWAGIRPRFPFYDRRLMEYCLSLPVKVKLRDGWSRWVLRAAMEGTVPETVRWRTSKANLGVSFDRSFRTADKPALLHLEDDCRRFDQYLDADVIRSLVERYLDGEDIESYATIWRPAVLARWFQRCPRAPEPPGSNPE
jgi:asparagine synthase (glutamine-hydrolysing)